MEEIIEVIDDNVAKQLMIIIMINSFINDWYFSAVILLVINIFLLDFKIENVLIRFHNNFYVIRGFNYVFKLILDIMAIFTSFL